MDEQLNIEKFSNIELDQDSVKSISKQCNDLKSLQKQIEDKEKEISELKTKAKNYEEKIIPDMLVPNACTSNLNKGTTPQN